MPILPRLIRLRDAPAYLGINRNTFNRVVRPALSEVSLGRQTVLFDRVEIDAWAEDYIRRNGRRPKASKLEDDTCQNAITCRDSASKAGSGKLKNAVNTSQEAGSVKARDALAALRRRKS